MDNRNNSRSLVEIIRELKNFEKEKLSPWVIDHEKEVAIISYRMGELLKLKYKQLAALTIAARFHDIGKTRIDRKIVERDSELGVIEVLEILDHVEFSYNVLKERGITWNLVFQTVLSHHENFNGTGYPNKLKENEIPIAAQILRIVDSFSAIHGSRPYPNSQGRNIEISMKEIEDKKGIFYNPEIVDVFLGLVKQSITVSLPEQEPPVVHIDEILHYCGIKSGKFFTVIRKLANTLDRFTPLREAA